MYICIYTYIPCIIHVYVSWRFWILDSGFQIPYTRFQILDTGFQILDSGFRIDGVMGAYVHGLFAEVFPKGFANVFAIGHYQSILLDR